MSNPTRAAAISDKADQLPRLICRCRHLDHVKKAIFVAHRCRGPMYPAYSTKAAEKLAATPSTVFIDMTTTAFDHAGLEAEFAGAVVVDVSQLTSHTFDERNLVASVGPGLMYRAFLAECRKLGLRPSLLEATDGLYLDETVLDVLSANPNCGARVQAISPLDGLNWIGLDNDPEIVNMLLMGGPEKRVVTCIEVSLVLRTA